MMEKKVDRRVVKTKKAIRNAFVTLLTKKETDAITVKEIADLADVDRKTVYNYYAGVNEIVEELENELAISFEKVIGEFEFNSIEDTMAAFNALNGLLNENMELYTLIMKIDGKSHLMMKIMGYLKNKIRTVLDKTNVATDKIDVAVEYITAGMFTAYRYWFNSERKLSLEEFTEDVACLVIGGLPTYFLGA